MIICRLDTETAAHASNDRLSTNLNALFRSGTDAIVFTDTKGLIDAANEAFLEMVDFGHQSDVRGRNLSEYMARGQIDLDALLENALRSGHMRVYSTKLSNDMGVWTSVEMSVTYLQDVCNHGSKPTRPPLGKCSISQSAMPVSGQGTGVNTSATCDVTCVR